MAEVTVGNITASLIDESNFTWQLYYNRAIPGIIGTYNGERDELSLVIPDYLEGKINEQEHRDLKSCIDRLF